MAIKVLIYQFKNTHMHVTTVRENTSFLRTPRGALIHGISRYLRSRNSLAMMSVMLASVLVCMTFSPLLVSWPLSTEAAQGQTNMFIITIGTRCGKEYWDW